MDGWVDGWMDKKYTASFDIFVRSVWLPHLRDQCTKIIFTMGRRIQPFQGWLFRLFHWLSAIDCDALTIGYCCGSNIVWGVTQSGPKQDIFGLVYQPSDGKFTYTGNRKMLMNGPHSHLHCCKTTHSRNCLTFEQQLASRPCLQRFFQCHACHFFSHPSPKQLAAQTHRSVCWGANDLHWHCCWMEKTTTTAASAHFGGWVGVVVNISKVNIMRPSEHKWGYKAIRRWFWVNMHSTATYLNLPWQCWHWSPTHPRSQMHDPLTHFPERQLLSHGFAGEAWVNSTK